MKAVEFADQIAVQDETRCFGCGQSYEVMLLIPAQGNRRRFTRHYRCDCCEEIFVKYDFGSLAAATRHFVRKLLRWVSSLVSRTSQSGLSDLHVGGADEVENDFQSRLDSPVDAALGWHKKTSFRTIPQDERKSTGTLAINVWTAAPNRRMSVPVHLA